MAIVFEKAVIDGPATHALVIGVGDYPHLLGGSSDIRAKFPGKMRQLSSPQTSARAFADWLIGTFSNPQRPLASVELLVDTATLPYQPPTHDGVLPPPAQTGAASLNDISDAAVRWKDRGNAHPENLLIFFFSGHGLLQGNEFAIVASDYGANPGKPLNGLIDVRRFLLGMTDCATPYQCYFMDACRTSDDSLLDAENYGDELVQKVAAPTPGLAQCVYYSTLGGATAHGRKNTPSFYTQALIRALDGAGASNAGGGEWHVNTTRMFEALSHLMREIPEPGMPRVQIPVSGSQVTFDLHHITGMPPVALSVEVDNHAAASPPPAVTALTIRQGGTDIACYPDAAPPLPVPCVWRMSRFESWITAGMTSLTLAKGAAEYTEEHYIMPPGLALKGW